MKDAHITEILMLLVAGSGGIIIWNGGWIGLILGFFIFALDSYLVGKLKRETVNEVLEVIKENYYLRKKVKKK